MIIVLNLSFKTFENQLWISTVSLITEVVAMEALAEAMVEKWQWRVDMGK